MIVETNFAPVDTKKILFPSAYVLSGDTVWTGDGIADSDKDDYSQNCVGGDTNGIPSCGWQVHNKGQNILFSDYHVRWYKRLEPNEMTFRYDSMQNGNERVNLLVLKCKTSQSSPRVEPAFG